MKIFSINKRSGGKREIFSPSPSEKKVYRDILDIELSGFPVSEYAHGFAHGRSIVTNALQHRGFLYSLSFDISNFFPSCTIEMANKLPQIVKDKCFLESPSDFKKAARQGLPTSPAIANIIAGEMDNAIIKQLNKKIEEKCSYTRYADDLTISFNNVENKEAIIKIIEDTVSRCGFKLNKKKTKMQSSINGNRREICGVTVDDQIHASRKMRRKLRAAAHNMNKGEGDVNSLKGLVEFCKLKEPKQVDKDFIPEVRRMRDAEKIAREYKLKSPIPVKKVIKEQVVDRDVIITNDPVYFFGMSAITNGWTSCMNINKRDKRSRGVAFWQALEGVSLAVVLSARTKSICGVERREMEGRVLVYALRDGRKAYGRGYGDKGEYIKAILESKGYKLAESVRGNLVVGNVPSSYPKPYMDKGSIESIRIKDKDKKAWRVKL